MGKVSTSWIKGQSGNPKGGPKKGYSITETMKEMLAADPKIKKALSQVVLQAALKGDLVATKLLWNYMDGMPEQATDITSKGQEIKQMITLDTHEDSTD